MAGENNAARALQSGKSMILKHPPGGTMETVRLGIGQTLDLSLIAQENITLLKLDGRLVVLFPDKAHIVVEGLFLPNGQPAPDVSVNLDGQTTIDAPIFVGQFPISSDEQILTAAGITLPARGPAGASGLNDASFDITPIGGRGSSLLLSDETGSTPAEFKVVPSNVPSQNSNAAAVAPPTPLPAPSLMADSAAVRESGVQAGNSPFDGTPAASGNLLANDSVSGTAVVTGFGPGVAGAAANPGQTIEGSFGHLFLLDDGNYTYTLDNSLPSVQALRQDQVVTEVFSYSVTDASGLTSTATLTVTITGTNDLPTLDLDSGTAGTGYVGVVASEAARSSTSVSAEAGVAIARAGGVEALDPDQDAFSRLEVSVAATASGARGELVSGASHGTTLVFEAPPGGFSVADVETLIANLRYVNTETTFALDTADRTITLTLTDAFGGQVTVEALVPVIADVRDTTGLDSFSGTRFDDRIDGMGGADAIHAGAGNDTVLYRAGDGADVLLDGGAGIDTLQLSGTAGADLFHVTFNGSALDRLTSGPDALTGGTNLSGFEAVSLEAGGEADSLDYSGSAAAVSVDLSAGMASGFAGIAGIRHVTGTDGRDTLTGDGHDNILDGGADDDVIDGRAGNNTLIGGAGNDTLRATDGDNTVDAGTGNNTVVLGNGDNSVTALEGNDIISLGNGDNSVDAGEGDNTLTAGDGSNDMRAGNGNNLVTAGDGDNLINLGQGDNTVTSGAGADEIVAGDGSNTIRAGNGDNAITLGHGSNDVTAGGGSDTILAGDGGNTIVAGDGDNSLTTGAGTDDISTGAGHDTILAGSGDNLIHAGDGDNHVEAGAGNDEIHAGNGNDTLLAGDGDNTVDAGGGETNTVETGAGNDQITVSGSVADTVRTGAGDDTITLAGSGDAEVFAGAGDDSIIAGIGNDLIYGDDGFDTLVTGAGADTVAFTAVATNGEDSIADFETGIDSLLFLAEDIGTGLAEGGADDGTLEASRFVSGTDFTDADQRFLFNTDTNTLYYDADGADGASTMIALAHLETGTSVSASDIRIA